MIVVDSSALIAIVQDEPLAEACSLVLADNEDFLITAPTLTEVLVVSARQGVDHEVRHLIESFDFEIIPLTADRAYAAADAYRRFGKSFHPAKLNYGDCFSYVLAIEHDCPLLFVGDDFTKTDVRSAIDPQRVT